MSQMLRDGIVPRKLFGFKHLPHIEQEFVGRTNLMSKATEGNNKRPKWILIMDGGGQGMEDVGEVCKESLEGPFKG